MKPIKRSHAAKRTASGEMELVTTTTYKSEHELQIIKNMTEQRVLRLRERILQYQEELAVAEQELADIVQAMAGLEQ